MNSERGASAPRRSRRASGAVMVAVLAAGSAIGLSGCVLTPRGTDEVRQQLKVEGKPYEPKVEERVLPDLPERPEWHEVLRRSFLANGELEAAYFQWKAAVERIDAAGAWPNSDVSLGFEYMFSGGRMKAFDRTTITAGFDPMENLSFPTKTAQAAKVALGEARAAGERFRVAKFELQRKVLSAWADYTLQALTIRTLREDLELRRMLVRLSGIRAQAGARQQATLEADIAVRMAESDLADLEAEHRMTRATLNGLLGRDAEAPLEPPIEPAPPRPIPVDDAEMLRAAVESFPQIGVFLHEVESRRDALELARMRWIPDINPMAAFNGGISQAIGFAITLPTTIPEILAQIREAEADLRASEAMLRQGRYGRLAEYVGLLVTYRNAERRARVFEVSILPAAQRLVDNQMRAYEAGAAQFADIVTARRTLLEVRLTVARAQAVMEKALVDIECCLGLDIETLINAQPDGSRQQGTGNRQQGEPPAPASTTTDTDPVSPEAHHDH